MVFPAVAGIRNGSGKQSGEQVGTARFCCSICFLPGIFCNIVKIEN